MDYTSQLNEIVFYMYHISGLLMMLLGMFAFYIFAFGMKR